MGTITFKVHPITPTSPRNTLGNIFKSILILFAFDFSLHIFLFEYSMCGNITETEENTQLCKLKHPNFAMLKHIDVIHDWRVLVVRWLFMPFS